MLYGLVRRPERIPRILGHEADRLCVLRADDVRAALAVVRNAEHEHRTDDGIQCRHTALPEFIKDAGTRRPFLDAAVTLLAWRIVRRWLAVQPVWHALRDQPLPCGPCDLLHEQAVQIVAH